MSQNCKSQNISSIIYRPFYLSDPFLIRNSETLVEALQNKITATCDIVSINVEELFSIIPGEHLMQSEQQFIEM